MRMQYFYTWISWILRYREYGYEITDPYIIYPILGIKYTLQSVSTTPTIAPLTWECGGTKEEWDNRDIYENLYCMDFQPAAKKPSFNSNERPNWPLHQPTWKGIQLPWNWFTSRESERSLCNGQAKSLQNSKGQLTNDQNIFSFLFKSFY